MVPGIYSAVLYHIPFAAVWVKRHPWITGVIIAILYVLTIVLYPDSQGMPSDLLLTTRLPELAFGMYFVRFIKKVPHVWVQLR